MQQQGRFLSLCTKTVLVIVRPPHQFQTCYIDTDSCIAAVANIDMRLNCRADKLEVYDKFKHLILDEGLLPPDQLTAGLLKLEGEYDEGMFRQVLQRILWLLRGRSGAVSLLRMFKGN